MNHPSFSIIAKGSLFTSIVLIYCLSSPAQEKPEAVPHAGLAKYRAPAEAPWMPRLFISSAAKREVPPPAAVAPPASALPPRSLCSQPDTLPASCPRHLAGRPRVYTENTAEHNPISLPPVGAVGDRAATDIELNYGSHIFVPSDSPNMADCFAVIRDWEPNTWRVFHSFIGSEMIYVGFGEWNGFTALIASNYAKLAIGLEPDPPANVLMMDNFLFNPQLPLLGAEMCISNETGELIMSGLGQTGSMLETVKGYFHPHVWERKTVQCAPLPEFLEQLHRAAPSVPLLHSPDWIFERRLFIKVDTEGAETFIIPSLTSWVRCLPKRPVFFISLHGTLPLLSFSERLALVAFFKSFRYALKLGAARGLEGKGEDLLQKLSVEDFEANCGESFTDAMLEVHNDYIATDILPVRRP